MRKTHIILVIFISLPFLQCNSLLKSVAFIRKQNIKNAAHKYLEGNWLTRIDALKEISRYIGSSDNELIEGVLLIAAKEQHTEVRIEALKILRLLKTKNTVETIKQLAIDEDIDNVRWYALQTLASYKDPKTLDAFRIGLNSDDWLIRETSIKGVIMLEGIADKQNIIPLIIKAINDTNNNVISAALHNTTIRDQKIYDEIASQFVKVKGSQYSLIKAYLIGLKGYRLDSKTREKVIRFLVHDNSNIRILALRVLKKEKILEKMKKK